MNATDAVRKPVQLSRRNLIGGGLVLGGAAVLAAGGARAHGSTAGGVANVRDAPYNAVGDGVTNDSAAIRAAFASNRDVIYFPAGVYKLTGEDAAFSSAAALGRTEKTLVIVGDGPQATRIVWTPSVDGADKHLFLWSTTDANSDSYDRLEVRDITLQTTLDAGTAVHATKRAQATRLRQQVLIDNVEFTGAGSEATFKNFKRAIFLDGLENIRIRGVSAENYWYRSGSVGIEITCPNAGTPPNNFKTTMAEIHHATIQNFEIGVRWVGAEEGLMLTDSNIFGCVVGVYCDTTHGLPGVNVHGSHFACRMGAIWLTGVCQVMISDNLVYLLAPSGGSATAIHAGLMNGGGDRDILVRGNIIMDLSEPGATTYGVIVPDASGNDSVLLADNHLNGLDVGVWLMTSTSGVFVAHTNRYRACGTNLIDQGTNTIQP